MKSILAILLFSLVTFSAHAKPQKVWDIPDDAGPERSEFLEAHQECADFAYGKKKTISSFEQDIQIECLLRKGFTFKTIEVP